MKTTKTLSKAAAKRLQTATNNLNQKLRTELADLENRFLGAYVSWGMMKIARVAEQFAGIETYEQAKRDCVGMTGKQFNYYMGRKVMNLSEYSRKADDMVTTIVSDSQVYSLWTETVAARRSQQLDHITRVKLYAEVAEIMDQRYEKLVADILNSDLDLKCELHIKSKEITNGEFDVVITDSNPNNKIEIHANVIYACGEVNRPHYRFLVKQRKQRSPKTIVINRKDDWQSLNGKNLKVVQDFGGSYEVEYECKYSGEKETTRIFRSQVVKFNM